MAINWTQATLPAAAAGKFLNDIAYGGGRYVVVANNLILHSDDGVAWTAITLTNMPLEQVEWVGTQFVAVSQSMYGRSVDGITWTFAPLPRAALVNKPASNGNGIVVVTNYYNENDAPRFVFHSTDNGNTFTEQTCGPIASGPASNRLNIPLNQTFRTRCLGGLFISTGRNPEYGAAEGSESQAICTSPDGLNWTRRECGEVPGTYVQTGNAAWDGTTYHVFNDWDGPQTAYTSPNGLAWTKRATNLPQLTDVKDTIGIAGGFLFGAYVFSNAAAHSGFSADGLDWALIHDTTGVNQFSVLARSNDKLVALGGSSILTAPYTTAPPLFWSNRIDCTETVR